MFRRQPEITPEVRGVIIKSARRISKMCILWVTGIKIVCYLGCVKEANQLSTCRAIEKSFHCMHFNFRVANTGYESTSRKPVQLIYFFYL